jgi:predicted ATPase/DNA-binding winged helix-turn-helix (wHTH) protein
MDILAVLLERPGEAIGKRELIARVWPNTVVEEGNLKVHVSALRRALGETEQGSNYIATISGRGYCFVAPVHTRTSAAETSTLAQVTDERGLQRAANRLIGREASSVALVELLRLRRLVTIVGPAGIGKTVVGMAVAEACAAQAGMKVCFVDFGALDDERRTHDMMADAVALCGRALDAGGNLAAALRGMDTLLVFDNCDHVIDSAAVLASRIVTETSGAHVLCTSREPLRADGEHVYRLGALSVPPPGAVDNAGEALAYSAVELFARRAAEATGSFQLTDGDVEDVIEVCRRLEGNALAIELAATRIDAFNPRELAAQLDDCLQLLARGRRSILPRHRSLANALDWSYAYLPGFEQRLMRAVSVFDASFTLDAACALFRDEDVDPIGVVTGLGDLVAKSILFCELQAANSCYRMPGVIKAYALSKLEEEGETSRYRQRHAEIMRDTSTSQRLATYEQRLDDLRRTLALSITPGKGFPVAVTPSNEMMSWSRLAWSDGQSAPARR